MNRCMSKEKLPEEEYSCDTEEDNVSYDDDDEDFDEFQYVNLFGCKRRIIDIGRY